jgi:hypothetical protein
MFGDAGVFPTAAGEPLQGETFQMRNVKMVGLCLVAAFACCAAAAASADAETGPLFGLCGEVSAGAGQYTDAHCEDAGTGSWETKLLQDGEALTVLASAIGDQKLETAADGAESTIECSGLSLAPGAYFEGGDPGTDHETLVYSGCSMPKNTHPTCDVNSVGQAKGSGIVETKPLESELVYLTKSARESLAAAETGTLFKPASGSIFVEMELTALGAGAKCPFAGKLKITGAIVFENVDASARQLLGLLKAESGIKKYYIDSMSAPEEKKVKLEFGGVGWTVTGEVSLEAQSLGSGTPVAFWVCP